jgi:hypothetical protein
VFTRVKRIGGKRTKRGARRLVAETTMTLDWIAKELNMGMAGSPANLLREKK